MKHDRRSGVGRPGLHLEAEAAPTDAAAADQQPKSNPVTRALRTVGLDTDTASLKKTLRGLVGPTAGLLAWVYIYLLVLLGGWVGLSMLTTGWKPVVVVSGSMEPTLGVGDVLLIDDHPDELVGQRAVVTFPSPTDEGSLITHRVFAVEQGEYITKGDANPTPDTTPVDPATVTGVGRLVVPLIGDTRGVGPTR